MIILYTIFSILFMFTGFFCLWFQIHKTWYDKRIDDKEQESFCQTHQKQTVINCFRGDVRQKQKNNEARKE